MASDDIRTSKRLTADDIRGFISGNPEYHTGWYRQCQSCKNWQDPKFFTMNGRICFLCQRLHRYNLTIERFTQMLNSQEWRCAICHEELEVICVDHVHGARKMVIRGLLCSPCNLALGLFRDSQANLQRAEQYLNHIEHWTIGNLTLEHHHLDPESDEARAFLIDVGAIKPPSQGNMPLTIDTPQRKKR